MALMSRSPPSAPWPPARRNWADCPPPTTWSPPRSTLARRSTSPARPAEPDRSGTAHMAQIILDRLTATFGGGEILETGSQHGNEWARIRPEAWTTVARFLRDDPTTQMDMFVDLTVVDRFGREPRFDVV